MGRRAGSWRDYSPRNRARIPRGWFKQFEQRRGRSPAPHTVRLHIGALKSYYAFLERFDLIGKNPMRQIDSPQPPRRVNDWLSQAEDEALLRACVTANEKVVVWLLRFTGLELARQERFETRMSTCPPARRGVRLEVVSKLLGHASTTITEHAYAELLDATIAAEVLSATA